MHPENYLFSEPRPRLVSRVLIPELLKQHSSLSSGAHYLKRHKDEQTQEQDWALEVHCKTREANRRKHVDGIANAGVDAGRNQLSRLWC